VSVIYKHGPYYPGDTFEIPGQVVHFGIQGQRLYVWTHIDSSDILEIYTIKGTGMEFPEEWCPLATAVYESGTVWHLIWIPKNSS
jgi:hypothetical protein